jgi:hypothetical protein
MSTQILDGLLCNEHGFPVNMECGIVIGGLSGDNSVTNLGYNVENDGGLSLLYGGGGWPGISSLLQRWSTSELPFTWMWDVCPGPTFSDINYGVNPGRWYSATSFIDVLDDSTGSRKPSWRATPGPGVPIDTTDRSAIIRYWKERRQVADDFGLKYGQYHGMLHDRDSIALAVADPPAWRAKWQRVLAFAHEELKADAIAFDITAWVGSYFVPGNIPNPTVRELFEEALTDAIKRRYQDPTFPLVCTEPRPYTSVKDSDPRAQNSLLGPAALGKPNGSVGYGNWNDRIYHHNIYALPQFQGETTSQEEHRTFWADFTNDLSDNPQATRDIVRTGDVPLFSAATLAFGTWGTKLPPKQLITNPIDRVVPNPLIPEPEMPARMSVAGFMARRMLDELVDALDESSLGTTAGTLTLYSGPRPGRTTDQPNPTCLALAEFRLSLPAFSNAELTNPGARAIANVMTQIGTAQETGVATWFRARNGEDEGIIDGSVGTAGSDLVMANTNITEGQTITPPSWQITMNESEDV